MLSNNSIICYKFFALKSELSPASRGIKNFLIFSSTFSVVTNSYSILFIVAFLVPLILTNNLTSIITSLIPSLRNWITSSLLAKHLLIVSPILLEELILLVELIVNSQVLFNKISSYSNYFLSQFL